MLPRLAVVISLPLLVACGGAAASPPAPAAPEAPAASAPAATPASAASAPAPAGATASATLEARSGSTLAGTATLTEEAGGVRVRLSLSGVTPGDHGAHVHEQGDCSAMDGSSAGGHFNPAGHPHALPATPARHLGDLGNVTIAADGTGTIDITIPDANLKAGDPRSFLGRSIIVHANADDGGQPTGNAGGRIGCGVVR